MLDLVFVLIALFGAVAASITDLREGIIPNKLSMPLIVIGIVGHLISNLYGLSTGVMTDFSLFLVCLKNVGLIFAVGYVFWILGGWSAGDVKEFMFLAALIPQYPLFLSRYFNPRFFPEVSIHISKGFIGKVNIFPYPFIISLLVNTFLSILPFIFIFSVYISITKIGPKAFLEPLNEVRDYSKKSIIFVGALVIVSILGISKIWIIPLLLMLYLIEERKGIIISTLISIIYILIGGDNIINSLIFVIQNLIIIFLILLVFDLFLNSFKVLKKEALEREIKITSLKEGMVIADQIYREKGKIVRDERGIKEKIKDAIEKKDIDILKKRPLIANTTAAGIDKKELKTLIDLVKEEELEDRIRIKRAMPFAPIILLGLIITLTIGDLAFYISMLL